jgi:hypothetical protein
MVVPSGYDRLNMGPLCSVNVGLLRYSVEIRLWIILRLPNNFDFCFYGKSVLMLAKLDLLLGKVA